MYFCVRAPPSPEQPRPPRSDRGVGAPLPGSASAWTPFATSTVFSAVIPGSADRVHSTVDAGHDDWAGNAAWTAFLADLMGRDPRAVNAADGVEQIRTTSGSTLVYHGTGQVEQTPFGFSCLTLNRSHPTLLYYPTRSSFQPLVSLPPAYALPVTPDLTSTSTGSATYAAPNASRPTLSTYETTVPVAAPTAAGHLPPEPTPAPEWFLDLYPDPLADRAMLAGPDWPPTVPHGAVETHRPAPSRPKARSPRPALSFLPRLPAAALARAETATSATASDQRTTYDDLRNGTDSLGVFMNVDASWPDNPRTSPSECSPARRSDKIWGPWESNGPTLVDSAGNEVQPRGSIDTPPSFVWDSDLSKWLTYRRNFFALQVRIELPLGVVPASLRLRCDPYVGSFGGGRGDLVTAPNDEINHFEVTLTAREHLSGGRPVELVQFSDSRRSLRLATALSPVVLQPLAAVGITVADDLHGVEPLGLDHAFSAPPAVEGDAPPGVAWAAGWGRVQFRRSTSNRQQHDPAEPSWKGTKRIRTTTLPREFAVTRADKRPFTGGPLRKAPPLRQGSSSSPSAAGLRRPHHHAAGRRATHYVLVATVWAVLAPTSSSSSSSWSHAAETVAPVGVGVGGTSLTPLPSPKPRRVALGGWTSAPLIVRGRNPAHFTALATPVPPPSSPPRPRPQRRCAHPEPEPPKERGDTSMRREKTTRGERMDCDDDEGDHDEGDHDEEEEDEADECDTTNA